MLFSEKGFYEFGKDVRVFHARPNPAVSDEAHELAIIQMPFNVVVCDSQPLLWSDDVRRLQKELPIVERDIHPFDKFGLDRHEGDGLAEFEKESLRTEAIICSSTAESG